MASIDGATTGRSMPDAVRGLTAAVRALPGPGRGAAAAEATRALLELVDAANAALLAAVAVVAVDGPPADDVAIHPRAWLQRESRGTKASTAALLSLARSLHLGGRHPVPATAAALGHGQITLEQARAITAVVRQAPPQVLEALEAALLAHADLPAEQLRTYGGALAQRLTDQARDHIPDSERDLGGRWLRLTPTIAGMVHLDGMLEPATAALLRAALDPLARPSATLDEHDQPLPDPRTHGERLHDALDELATLAAGAADAMPAQGGARPHLHVLIDADTLLGREPTGRTGLTGPQTLDGQPLDPHTLDHTTCDPHLTWTLVHTPDPQPPDSADLGDDDLGDDGVGDDDLGEGDCENGSGGPPAEGARVGAEPDRPPWERGSHATGTPSHDPTSRPYRRRGRAQVDIDPVTLRTALACLSPALGGLGITPLAQGRTTRLVTPAQRQALNVRDRGCVIPGCDAPAWRCHAHHLVPWTQQGATDLTNLALVCSAHHRLIHTRHWHLHHDPATGRYTVRVPPPMLDQTRRAA